MLSDEYVFFNSLAVNSKEFWIEDTVKDLGNYLLTPV